MHSVVMLVLMLVPVCVAALTPLGAQAGQRGILSRFDAVLREGQIPRSNLLAAPKPLPEGTHFMLVHIPKNAGSSFLMDAASHMPSGVRMNGNEEVDVETTEETWPGRPIVLMFRHPWKQVLSAFLQCKYSAWGKHMTRDTKFPRGSLEVAVDGFSTWVDHFLDEEAQAGMGAFQNREYSYRCYNPWNIQTRHMAPDHKAKATYASTFPKLSSDSIQLRVVRAPEERRPKLARAMKAVRRASFIGIADLYDQTACLFHFHTTGALPAGCACGGGSTSPHKHHKIIHQVPHHSINDLPSDLLAKVYKLVELDVKLFVHSLGLFEEYAKQVQEATGVQVVCEADIASLRENIDSLTQASTLRTRKADAGGKWSVFGLWG